MTKAEKLTFSFLVIIIILLFIAICIYTPKLATTAIIFSLTGLIFGMLAGLSR